MPLIGNNFLLLEFDIGGGLISSAISPLSLSEYGYYDNISGTKSTLTMPLNLRIGYIRKLDSDSFIGLNLVYTKINTKAEIEKIDGEYVYNKTYYSSFNKAEITSQQVGVETIMISSDGTFLSIGVVKDKGSNISFPVKSGSVKKDLNGVYLPIRFGGFGKISDNLYANPQIATSLYLNGDSYVHNLFSINISLTYLW